MAVCDPTFLSFPFSDVSVSILAYVWWAYVGHRVIEAPWIMASFINHLPLVTGPFYFPL